MRYMNFGLLLQSRLLSNRKGEYFLAWEHEISAANGAQCPLIRSLTCSCCASGALALLLRFSRMDSWQGARDRRTERWRRTAIGLAALRENCSLDIGECPVLM